MAHRGGCHCRIHPACVSLIRSCRRGSQSAIQALPPDGLQLQPHLDPQVPQHPLFADRLAEGCLQSECGHQDELSMLGRPVGLDSNHELLGSVEEPALTLGLFLVLDVVRLLLPHALDSDERT